MVQIIPKAERKPSFSERLSLGIGRGLDMGNQMMQQQQQKQALQQLGIDPSVLSLPEQGQAAYFKSKFAPEKPMTPLQISQQKLNEERLRASQSQQSIYSKLFGGGDQEQMSPEQGFGDQQDQMQQQNQMQPFDLKNVPEEKLRQGAAFAGQPGEMGVVGNMFKSEQERREKQDKLRTDKEKQYFKVNEPKVMELSDTLNKLEMEQSRYDRLGQLFSEPEKFPSALTAALFSKDGQLNDIVYSQLTPEAQEAIKLIIDSTSNIKDTYGARVTNFDLQTYLKKLPGLMNTTEGKMRVLRDLQIMNKLNQLHASGIQDIFDEEGGTDKIPYSTAEKLYKKKYGALERQLRDQFVNPEKATFNDLPDAQKYLGRKVKNPETGEIFISDGNEWKPFKG